LRIYSTSTSRGGLNFFVLAEPKIRPIPSACSCLLDTCLDDLGTSHPQIRAVVSSTGIRKWQHVGMIDPFDPTAKTVTLLKANYRLVIDVNHQTIDFIDLATKPSQTQTFDGGTISVGQYANAGPNQTITVGATATNGGLTTISRLGGGTLQFANPPCQISLLNDQGLPITIAQIQMRSAPGSMSVTFSVAAATKLTRVRCDISGDQRTLNVPVEFHDVPVTQMSPPVQLLAPALRAPIPPPPPGP
jgi:hypothetical protein